MAEAKLSIRVDTRQVSGLEKLLKRVFSRSTPREFNSALRETDQALERNRRGLEAIVTQMNKVGEGTKAFKELNKQLKETNKEMDQLSKARGGIAGGGAAGGAGGMQRGRGGGGGFQVPMPSMGGLATALGALPVAGALMAGGLMTAAGAHGSFLQMQQANVAAAPFLMSQASMTGFRGPTGTASPWTHLGGGSPEQQRLGRLMDMMSLVPGGGLASSMMGVAQRFGQRHSTTEAALAAQAGGGGTPGSAIFNVGAFQRAGRMFGVSPQESIQQAAAMAQAAGQPVGAGQFGMGLAMQRRFGVGLQEQGGFMRGARWTGNMGSMQELADMIGIAVTGGLEGSDIGRFLGEQSQWLQGMYAQGFNVSLPGLTAGAAALSASGIGDPFRAMSAARAFGAGAANVGRTGPTSGAHLRLMRAMGFTGKGGFEEYSEFKMRMQDPGQVAAAIPGYLKTFKISGGKWAQANLFQQAMGAFGADITADDALRMAGGIKSGKFGQADLAAILASGQGMQKGLGGALIAKAGIEAERIGVGAAVSPAMQALERASLNVAKSITGVLGKSIEDFAFMVDDATALIASSVSGFSATISLRQ